MKVLISAEGPALESAVSDRFGTAPYFLVVDLEDLSVISFSIPEGQAGAGLQAVTLAFEQQVGAVLTGYCSPVAEKYLAAQGIPVVQGLRGKVSDVLKRYKRDRASGGLGPRRGLSPGGRWRASLQQTLRQFAFMLPLIAGILGLLGLFNAFVPQRVLLSVFSGNKLWDTWMGACVGSLSAGNPINSYIIGGGLLKRGVSLYGITAFMVAWVSVGLIQLPAEMGAMGSRFAILRNLLSFLVAGGVAFLTVWSLQLFPGGTF